jgi:hypothetical protein
MANPENRASGPPPPGHEHDPAPRHEHHHATIVAGSHSAGGETAARDQSTRLAREASPWLARSGSSVNKLMAAQKNRAANGLHRLACALTDTTQNHEQNDRGSQIATNAEWDASRIESMSTYLRETEIPTILRDAGQFARRRPEVLLAGTILTGLVMGLVMERLLKSSRRGPAVPWAPATGRWHAALQKGTQAVSAAADTLKQGAEAQYVAIAGNRRRFTEADGAEKRPPCIAG